MSLILLEASLVPATVRRTEAAAASLKQPDKHVLLVGVPVATSLCHSPHHFLLGLSFRLRACLIVVFLEVLWACRIYSTYQRVLKLERLITAKNHGKRAPNDS